MSFRWPSRNPVPLTPNLPPVFIEQDAASPMPSTRLPEGSGLITQHAGIPQVPAPLFSFLRPSDETLEMQALADAIVNSREWVELDIECLAAEIEDLYASIVSKRDEITSLRVKLAGMAVRS